MLRSLNLPDFPWDTLSAARRKAEDHPEGLVDLSVGTPIDPTPDFIQRALADSANSPGYPLVAGTPDVRAGIRDWLRRRGTVDPGDTGVVPTTGSKEMVAWLPRILGLGDQDTVLFPDVAYPTYEVGALIAGAKAVPVDQFNTSAWPKSADLVWLNSPSNPTGEVLSSEQLRDVVEWARSCGAIVVSDECYAELPWSEPYVGAGIPSLLDEDVCGGDLSNLLLVYSLSKQSNMAGYRAAFVAGDPEFVGEIIEVRKHSGMMVPAPVQAAMAAALTDEHHIEEQRLIYGRRRQLLYDALVEAGFEPDPDTAAGLYLWLPLPGDWSQICDQSPGRCLVDWFAERGILVAPGEFYGPKGRSHVRIALTATDERIAEACRRLTS